ncbi:MAG TPA: diguanylate cyclase [Microthrixaceae bacterium]|nr:diguanylate cyclase [Microthrixaceae bacterium]
MNKRAIALLIGLISATLGLVALLVDNSIVGLLAGLSGLGAAALVLAPSYDSKEIADSATPTDDGNSQGVASGDPTAAEGQPAEREIALASERIRSLEQELESIRSERFSPPEERSALTDPESQLYSEAYFRVALDARIAAARRHLRPVAIALLEVNEGPASSPSPVPPARAAESIRQTIRDADTACRLNNGTFAIILEDTPENGAVWTVERVRRNLVSRFGSHTMWAGVACYPAHAFSTDELLAQADEALVSAREWQQDRIEVAISE